MTHAAAHDGVILVVDDDADIREALCEILASEGWSVESANNGREALAQLSERPERIRLVLLDLMMPQMNGWEFMAEQARDARLANIPVIVISASGSTPVVDAVGFLPKPLDLDRLLQLVELHAHPDANDP